MGHLNILAASFLTTFKAHIPEKSNKDESWSQGEHYYKLKQLVTNSPNAKKLESQKLLV